MTREHKLAVLIGFALVLVVGVVISDHFSAGRSARLGEATRVEAASDLTDFDAEEELGDVAAMRLTAAASIEAPPAGALGGMESGDGAGPSVLADALETAKGWADRVGPTIIDMGQQVGQSHEAVALHVPPTHRTGMDEQEAALRQEIDRVKGAAAGDGGAALASTDPRDGAPTHVVQDGESLWGIAKKHYGDGSLYRKLAQFNRDRVVDEETVRAGVTLFVPSKDVLLGRRPAGAPAKGLEQERIAPSKAVSPRESRQASSSPSRRHKVKKGETLGDIAKSQLGSARRWQEIADLNDDVLDDPDVVPAGTVLKLPAR